MFCSECGNKIELDYSIKFCKDCGTRIEWSDILENGVSIENKALQGDYPDTDFNEGESKNLLNEKSVANPRINQQYNSLGKLQANSIDSTSSLKNITDFNGLKVGLEIYNDKHFIPSYHISTSGINNDSLKLTPYSQRNSKGDFFSWVAIHVKNNSIGKKKVKISIIENEFMKNSEEEFEINKKGDVYLLPSIAWRYKFLKENKQISPFVLQVRFTSYDFTGKPKEQLLQETCQMVSINFCPIYAKREEKFLWNLFAAYVNEDHPNTEQIRKEALSLGLINQFFGGSNLEEVEAIWKALTNRGIQYSNITKTSFSQTYKDVFGQFVRLTGDVLNSEQANCADGSVFFASILQKIDFNVSLILVPGHMFIGIDGISGIGEIYIETTKLGEKGELKEALIDVNEHRFGELNDEFLTYNYATIFGSNSVQDLIDLNPELDEESAISFVSKFKKISINAAREQNVTPIGANDKILNK